MGCGLSPSSPTTPGASWLPGGFLGVDIFFALSGYLITYGLALDWERDRQLSPGRFYRRRGRRLLPALFLVLAAVAVYCVIALPEESYRLRGDLVAALAYGTNWAHVYWHQSYFAALGRPPLLQHLWSLAIEEQFYLVWPLVLMALGRYTKRRLTPVLFTAVLAAASAIWMAVQFDPFRDPAACTTAQTPTPAPCSWERCWPCRSRRTSDEWAAMPPCCSTARDSSVWP